MVSIPRQNPEGLLRGLVLGNSLPPLKSSPKNFCLYRGNVILVLNSNYTLMKGKVFVLGIFCFITANVMGQSLKTWNWGTYKMQFQAPSNFKVDKNNSEIFDAGNDDIHLTIYPEKGEKISEGEMASLLRTWAKDNKLKFDGRVQKMENLNGYWGVYVDGEANSLPTTILLLVDPDYPTISFYVWLQYDASKEDMAVKMLQSFIPS